MEKDKSAEDKLSPKLRQYLTREKQITIGNAFKHDLDMSSSHRKFLMSFIELFHIIDLKGDTFSEKLEQTLLDMCGSSHMTKKET